MMRVTVLAVSITLLFASSEMQCSNAYPSATIEIIQNGTEYLKANPNARLLTPSFSYQSTLGNELLYYRFGNRNSGDSLLADYFASQRWGSAMDVSSTVNYPPSGMGAKITFFQVFVDQSSKRGRVYIASGGIGYQYITIVIEAFETFHFQPYTYIYGY